MDWSDLVGRTISSVGEFGENAVQVFFDDGTSVIIDTEAIWGNLHRPVVMPLSDY